MQAAVLITALSNPWRKYNEFFDKGCKNIWGLSPIIKFTYLYFGLVIPYLFISTILPSGIQTIVEMIISIGTFLALAIWALYFPILVVITLKRAFTKVKYSAKVLNTTLSQKPWELTPKELYTQPHSIIFLYLIYSKNRIVDFLDWCTQFFPFDFIYPNRVRYPLTMKLRHNARHIEGLIADMNVPLKFVRYELNMQNTEYKFEFYESVRNIKKAVERLEKKFNNTGYFVREDDGIICVIDPHRDKY